MHIWYVYIYRDQRMEWYSSNFPLHHSTDKLSFRHLEPDKIFRKFPDPHIHTTHTCNRPHQIWHLIASASVLVVALSILFAEAMGEGQGLPCTGERCMIILDSLYGLCAYDRYYRDYNSTYTADSNGEIVEVPVDMSGLKYTLDETVVANMANAVNYPPLT